MAKIKLSKKNNISPDEFDPKNSKERISIWIDEDVLDEFKDLARKNNSKYQSLINEVLRAYAFSSKNKNVDKIIAKIETAIKELKTCQQT